MINQRNMWVAGEVNGQRVVLTEGPELELTQREIETYRRFMAGDFTLLDEGVKI